MSVPISWLINGLLKGNNKLTTVSDSDMAMSILLTAGVLNNSQQLSSASFRGQGTHPS